jgi:hypothetical protein
VTSKSAAVTVGGTWSATDATGENSDVLPPASRVAVAETM